MNLSNNVVVLAGVVIAVVGVALIVVVVFRFKKPRAGLRTPIVAPESEADRPRPR